MIKKSVKDVLGVIGEKRALFLAAGVMGVVFGITSGLIREGIAGNAAKPPDNLVADTSATGEEEAEAALKGRNVYFAGMDNILAGADTVVRLENLKDNGDILISYSILDNSTGEELFHTDLIPSGQHVDWKPSETMEAGSYDICYVQNPVWQDGEGNYISLTSADNVASLTLTLPEEEM